jgi:hypothetical protein
LPFNFLPPTLRWARHSACVRDEKFLSNIVLIVKPKGKDHLVNGTVDVRIILKRILKKLSKRAWTGFIRVMIRTSGVLL